VRVVVRRSIEALIATLVADARPTARMWPATARLGCWLSLVTAMTALVAAGAGWSVTGRHHPDRLAGELVAVLGAVIAWAALALRAAIPDTNPGVRALVATALSALLPLLFWTAAPGPALFVANGTPCALELTALAVVPCVALLWALARGAPLASRRAAGLSGGAGFLAAYLHLRLLCHIDQPAHLLVWHALPVALGIGLVAAGGGWWLARWRVWLPAAPAGSASGR
jgi:hypothetical protein